MVTLSSQINTLKHQPATVEMVCARYFDSKEGDGS